MMKFQYKVIGMEPGDDDKEVRLNKLGEQGWELVCSSVNSYTGYVTLLFKKSYSLG